MHQHIPRLECIVLSTVVFTLFSASLSIRDIITTEYKELNTLNSTIETQQLNSTKQHQLFNSTEDNAGVVSQQFNATLNKQLTWGVTGVCSIIAYPHENKTATECYEHKSTRNDKFRSALAFGIIGAVCAGFTVILLTANYVTEKRLLLIISTGAAVLCVVCACVCLGIVLGVVVHDYSNEDMTVALGLGFYICLVTILLGVAAVGLHVYMLTKTRPLQRDDRALLT